MDSPSRAPEPTAAPAAEPPEAGTPSLPPTGPAPAHATDVSFELRTAAGQTETPATGPGPATGRVGAYELLEEVAHGGMGVVYKARHPVMDRVVALKTVRADGAHRGQAERFEREVRAVARLSHPNIVPIYEVGSDQGRPFFTMAFVPGGSLAQARDRLVTNPRAAAALVEKIARAVQYAHERGVLHRDLKPGNVLLDERGEPHVTDFGLAKFQDGDVELTQTGAVLGTPAYMAPEQAAGRGRDIGPATDVWALGVILYELVAGRRPFVADSAEDVKRQILVADPPQPRQLRPGVGVSLETVILRCLEKDPARRYASAGALADDLGRYLRGEPTRARPPGRAGRAWLAARRHPVVAGVVLATVLGAVGTPAILSLTDPDRPLKVYRRRLDRGEAVTVVGRGAPQWFRWAYGQGAVTAPPDGVDDRHTFYFHSHDPVLMELLPPPLPERYWFRARVRLRPDDFARAGVYFGHSRRVTTRGAEQCYYHFSYVNDVRVALAIKAAAQVDPLHPVKAELGLALAFAARGPLFVLGPLDMASEGPPPRGEVRLTLWRKPEPGALTRSEHEATLEGMWKRFPSATAATGPLPHDLAVRVNPEGVAAYWDGEYVGTVPRGRVDGLAPVVLADNPELVPGQEFLPTGGLGLSVDRGGASFSEVVIEPLKPGEADEQ